jgi:hypothetical protein
MSLGWLNRGLKLRWTCSTHIRNEQ